MYKNLKNVNSFLKIFINKKIKWLKFGKLVRPMGLLERF